MIKKLSNINDPFALDDFRGEVNKLWMQLSPAREISTISTSFVLDRDGHIIFTGRSMRCDGVLPKVLQTIWRTRDEGKADHTTRISEGQRIARKQAGNVAFVIARKVGPDGVMPDMQVNLFCAPGVDGVHCAEAHIMGGHYEIHDRRQRQLFARRGQCLCRAEAESSQGWDWFRFNCRHQRRRHLLRQKALSTSAHVAITEGMSRAYAHVSKDTDKVKINQSCSTRVADSRWHCDIESSHKR